MESPILMLVFGIALGVLLAAKPIKELVVSIDEKAPTALPYVVLGFLLFTASWALGWLGFIVVVTTFGLYQVFGASEVTSKLRAFFSFGWLKRKKVEPAPVPEPAPAPVVPDPPPHMGEPDNPHPGG